MSLDGYDYFEKLAYEGRTTPVLTDEELTRIEEDKLYVEQEQKLGVYGWMEPHQIHDVNVLLVDKNAFTTYRKGKERKRVRNKRKLVYEPMSDWFFVYKFVDWNKVPLFYDISHRNFPFVLLDEDEEGMNEIKSHPMYSKLKYYETELGRELSFDEMKSHCTYETFGLLETEQKRLKKKIETKWNTEHSVVIVFKECVERIRKGEEIEILDHYRINRWGYIVPIGS